MEGPGGVCAGKGPLKRGVLRAQPAGGRQWDRREPGRRAPSHAAGEAASRAGAGLRM